MSQNQERIVLQPNYIRVQKENGRLIIIRKNRGFILASIFLLILVGIFYGVAVMGYMKILDLEANAISEYQKTRAIEIKKLKERYVFLEESKREGISKNFSSLRRKISSQKIKASTEALKSQITGDSLDYKNALHNLDSLRAAYEPLKAKADSLQTLDEVQEPRNAELSVEILEIENKYQYLGVVRTEEYVKIWGLIGFFFIIGSLFFIAIPYASGNDCWTIDKMREEIQFSKNRFRKVKITPTSNIKQFYCIQTGGEYSRVLLKYIDFENKEHLFIRRLTNAQEGIFIEQQIETFLEIEDIPIAGSIR